MLRLGRCVGIRMGTGKLIIEAAGAFLIWAKQASKRKIINEWK